MFRRAMSGMGRISTSTALVAVCAAAGCGGGGNSSTGSGASLSHPLYPRCTFPTFRNPVTTPVIGPGGGRAWQVAYLPPPQAPVQAAQTNNVLIIEQSPKLPQIGVKRGHTIVVAGRRVSFRSPEPRAREFVAQWNTKTARYVVIANGSSPTTIERFIACLP